MDLTSLFSLAGKRALVTGSSRGIGLAIAQALASAGAEVVLNGRDQQALGSAVSSLVESGAAARAVAFDVTSRESVTEAVAWIESELGPIDILVNNAGIQHRSPLETFPADRFEAVMATNVTSVFTVGQVVAQRMIPRGAGKIINITSLLSTFARSTVAPYSASKAAVSNLTRGMAVDWARYGINVNAIAPGYIRSDMNAALMADPEFDAWIHKRTPMGRWGEPEDLAGAAIFLASPAASFINGHVLYVDGAFTATF